MTAFRAFFAVGLAGLWLLVVVPPIFHRGPSVDSGVHAVLTGAPVRPNLVRVDPASPAFAGGLRTGDVLGCLSARDYALLILPSDGFKQQYRPGSVISTCVRRGQTIQTIRFTARAGPDVPFPYYTNALGALRVCVLLIFLITGIALVLVKPSPATWIFYAYCLSSAPSLAAQQATYLPGWLYALTATPAGFLTAMGASLLFMFAALVPDDRIPAGWRRTAFWAAAAACAAQAAYAGLIFIDTSHVYSLQTGSLIDGAITALTVLLVIARVVTMQSTERARFGWAAFAIIFGVVVNDLRNNMTVGGHQQLGIFFAYLTVVMPLSLTYAILKRHVIDVRFVISRTVVYAALTTLVVGVIGMVDWLTSAYLNQVRVAMAIDAAVTIGLAFALHRAYGWIEAMVDFVLFRRKHDAETYLHRMARTLLRAKSQGTVDRALVQAPYEKLELAMAALFRPAGATFAMTDCAGCGGTNAPALDPEHELVRFLSTERTKLHLRDLRRHVAEEFAADGPAPAVAIPLFQGDDLIAFAVYGIHRDGTKLDPDEIETLERLCEIGAQAYTAIELARYRTLDGSMPALEALRV